MRVGAALVGVGTLILLVQGGIATFVPPPFCPDLALITVLAIGLLWQGRMGGGLFVATLLGYAADLVSGSLFGQHALLRLCAFAVARMASRRMNIRGALPLACFAAAGSLLYAFGLAVLTGFFAGEAGVGWHWFGDLVIHAGVNGLFAPLVLRFVENVMLRLRETDSGRRHVRLAARERVT